MDAPLRPLIGTHGFVRRWVGLGGALAFLASCESEQKRSALVSEGHTKPVPASPEPAPAAKDRAAPAEALSQGLRSACLEAKQNEKPLVIEFSADWCGDCRKLEEMKQVEPLARTWRATPHFQVDVGHFDAHDELREAFGVKAIAAWHLVEPADCEAPASEWPRLASRTLEPRSGQAVTPRELADWLTEPR